MTSKKGALGVLRGLVGLEPFTEPLRPQGEVGHAVSHLSSQQEALSHTVAEAVPVRVVATQRGDRNMDRDRDKDGIEPDVVVASGGGASVLIEEYNEVLPPRLEKDLRRLERAARYGGNIAMFEQAAQRSSAVGSDESLGGGESTPQRPLQGKSLLFRE